MTATNMCSNFGGFSELVHQAVLLQELSENKEMQKLRRTCCSDSVHT